MFEFFKSKPKEETVTSNAVSRVEYHRMEDALNARIQACHTAIADMRWERDLARAEAFSNAADAAKYRRSVANLKQNRQAREKGEQAA